MSTALGKVCTACGAERKKKGIKYDPTNFMPYCDNPFVCNEDHPNAPKNLIARGSELALLPFEEAQEKFGAWIAMQHPNPEVADRIRRMVTMPTTVRIGDPGLAQFLLEFMDEYQFDNISETIRYCIQKMRESRTGFYNDHKELAHAKAEVERVEQTQQEVQIELAKASMPNQTDKPDENEDEDIVL